MWNSPFEFIRTLLRTRRLSRKYGLKPLERKLDQERQLARKFWADRPLEAYYEEIQPQTGLLIERLSQIEFNSIFEFGCNVGRNLYWIRKEYADVAVLGMDINESAIERGKDLFEFSGQELKVGDEEDLARLPTDGFDIVFTVSVLDHLPEIGATLNELLRIAAKRVMLLELVLPGDGLRLSDEIWPFSYSHNYTRAFNKLALKAIQERSVVLGEGPLSHYCLYELEPQ